MHDTGNATPDAQTVFDWVCAIRRGKLPDPREIGNVGSFFKNPVVSAEQCSDIIAPRPARSCTTRCPTAASSWPPAG